MAALKKKGASTASQEKKPRINPKKDQMINDYIAENPKEWDFLMEQDKERLARMVILGRAERKEAIDNAIWKSIEQDPAKKKQLEGLVRNQPKDQHRASMIDLEKKLRGQTRSLTQENTQKQEASKVAV